jgi:hypothetical protein
MRVRRRHRLVKVLAWGAVVLLASLGGGLWFAYVYLTDSDTLARLVKAELPRYLPGTRVEVGHARVRPLTGEVQLTQLRLYQSVDGVTVPTVRVPWLSVRHDPRAALEGRFEPSEVVVAHPVLRLCRRKDGTWNLQGLLANPWPGPALSTPPVLIQNATVELVADGADTSAAAAAVLRDGALKVEPARPGVLSFEGTARGDSFDRLTLRGTVEIATGRVELSGDVARLVVPDPVRGRVPIEARPALGQLGLTGGEADLRVHHVTFDPAAPPGSRLRYDVSGHLHDSAWNCPKLPFPINDLSAGFTARDGAFTVERAEGRYGATVVRVERAWFHASDPPAAPRFGLAMEVVDLELDEKLRHWAGPPELKLDEVWRDFQPSGRVRLSVRAGRDVPDGPVRSKVVVDCLDVAMLYRHFRYPLEHIRGRFVWEGERVTVEGLSTLVGGRPVSATGTIDHPGPGAVVALAFRGEALPVDKTLLDAMPPEVRAVVDDFNPTGTVRGHLSLRRTPPERLGDDPRGKVAIDAVLDLNERCGIRWVGLPYPVNNLTGRLEIHPNKWMFGCGDDPKYRMRGENAQAVITGRGVVEKVGGSAKEPKLKVDLELQAEKLPFDEQLRAALPPAWRKTWRYLDPTGSSDVDAKIRIRPDVKDRYVVTIAPRPATSVRLHYKRDPKPDVDPGGEFTLRMEDVSGRFVYNDGPVDMTDVGFRFHGTPVRFERGRVTVEDSGKFQLGTSGLWVKGIRLDSELRAIMPPVMAQFAQRLDDGRTFTLKGDLGLGWSGEKGKPVWCAWGRALAVFNDNAVTLQPGLGLEHMQGQLENVRGWTDGETFDLHGALRLESVGVLGQQVTRLESPIDVAGGVARLSSVRGTIVGGELTGALSVTLDRTPHYAATLELRGADLQEYARTLSGHQTFRGLVAARLDLEGVGGDIRTLQGGGWARVDNGDLGELPVYLRLVKLLNLSPATRTAFDAAAVTLTVRNGKSYFDPIQFTGSALSLHGRGTMDVQGDLDMRLRVLYGRDRVHLWLLSDALREASGKFLVVRVQGTPSFPKLKLEPFPELTDGVKSISRRPAERRAMGR